MSRTKSHNIFKRRDDETFRETLHFLIDNWLDDNLKGFASPKSEQEKEIVRQYNDKENKSNTPQTDFAIRECLNQLIDLHVPAHLVNTASHREWVRFSFQLLTQTEPGLKFDEELADRVLCHDLSKYSYGEVLGYAVMFGDGSETFRSLTDPDENREWKKALSHHFSNNDHHPEYFLDNICPFSADKICVSPSILSLAPRVAKYVLVESIFDMLACRGERSMKQDPEFSVTKWFDIDDKFLLRFAKEDKDFVRYKLNTFSDVVRKHVRENKNLTSPAGQKIVD